METRNTHAIRIHFEFPVDGQKVFYFGSLTDIFCRFTPEQIGANLLKLWRSHAGQGEKILTDKCTIERVKIIHYLHKKKVK